ncbi:MAG: hydrogenase maturation nickel metallochaperone HypA [candidate division WOR-3 bacterium]
MHEYNVTRALVELCHQEAQKHQLNQIKVIKIRIGKFTGFSPEAINFYFGYLKTGTRCENARLEFLETPIKIKCGSCDLEKEIEEPLFVCPECASPEIEVISGREFYVESIEGE